MNSSLTCLDQLREQNTLGGFALNLARNRHVFARDSSRETAERIRFTHSLGLVRVGARKNSPNSHCIFSNHHLCFI